MTAVISMSGGCVPSTSTHPVARPMAGRFSAKLAARGPLPGQCGIVVVHGRWVTAMDLFGAPHLLAAHWGALIRSHLLESPVATGRPSRA